MAMTRQDKEDLLRTMSNCLDVVHNNKLDLSSATGFGAKMMIDFLILHGDVSAEEILNFLKGQAVIIAEKYDNESRLPK